MTHVSIKCLAAGHRQKGAADHHQSQGSGVQR
jgi:hypothetical protein